MSPEDHEHSRETGSGEDEGHGEYSKGRGIKDVDSLSLLLSGEVTRGWKDRKTEEMADDVSPNTLISDHPEAVLREGRIVNYFECPDCGFMIEVTTSKRPLVVRCPSCTSRFRLKGKRSQEQENGESSDTEGTKEKPSQPDWDEKSKLSEEAMKYHTRGDLNRAIEVYDKILEISDNDPVVWNNKGVALDGLGMHMLAVKCYEKSIRLRDSYLDAWFNISYSQFQMKQFEKAQESLRTLLRLKPDHREGNILFDRCQQELKTWRGYLD